MFWLLIVWLMATPALAQGWGARPAINSYPVSQLELVGVLADATPAMAIMRTPKGEELVVELGQQVGDRYMELTKVEPDAITLTLNGRDTRIAVDRPETVLSADDPLVEALSEEQIEQELAALSGAERAARSQKNVERAPLSHIKLMGVQSGSSAFVSAWGGDPVVVEVGDRISSERCKVTAITSDAVACVAGGRKRTLTFSSGEEAMAEAATSQELAPIDADGLSTNTTPRTTLGKPDRVSFDLSSVRFVGMSYGGSGGTALLEVNGGTIEIEKGDTIGPDACKVVRIDEDGIVCHTPTSGGGCTAYVNRIGRTDGGSGTEVSSMGKLCKGKLVR